MGLWGGGSDTLAPSRDSTHGLYNPPFSGTSTGVAVVQLSLESAVTGQ
jgi:hypothetical protein